jgi:hypothetical protein
MCVPFDKSFYQNNPLFFQGNEVDTSRSFVFFLVLYKRPEGRGVLTKLIVKEPTPRNIPITTLSSFCGKTKCQIPSGTRNFSF